MPKSFKFSMDMSKPHRNWETKGLQFYGRASNTRVTQTEAREADPSIAWGRRFNRGGRP